MNHNDQSVNNNIRDAVNLQINSDVNIATIIQYIENFKSLPVDYFQEYFGSTQNHWFDGTKISGVDLSFLTPEQYKHAFDSNPRNINPLEIFMCAKGRLYLPDLQDRIEAIQCISIYISTSNRRLSFTRKSLAELEDALNLKSIKFE